MDARNILKNFVKEAGTRVMARVSKDVRLCEVVRSSVLLDHDAVKAVPGFLPMPSFA